MLSAQALFARMEGIVHACHMHILLLYEVTSDPALAHLTPINALRNAALLAVQTPLLVMVDVDLCVSASLVRFLSEPSNGDKLVASSTNTFWVLPAWDVSAGLSRVEIDHIAESALAGALRGKGPVRRAPRVVERVKEYTQEGTGMVCEAWRRTPSRATWRATQMRAMSKAEAAPRLHAPSCCCRCCCECRRQDEPCEAVGKRAAALVRTALLPAGARAHQLHTVGAGR